MKKIITLLIAFLFCLPVFSADYYGSTSGGVAKDTNCNQSKYFAIGKLCQDTDDAKLYKGTGSAVVEISNVVTGLTSASSVAITGGTINGTAIGATTPAAGTFTTLVGWKDEVIAPATGNITTAQMKGLIINNYGQTDDAALSLASFTKGLFFTVILGTTVAKYWRLDPNGSELIYLVSSGTATSCGAGKYVGIASAAAGATLSCVSFQTGASAYSLLCAPVSGTWACEP
jgi:hypothetical protein